MPSAPGTGNFEICLTNDADEKEIVVPPKIIFQSWGQITGAIRNSMNFDQNTTSGENNAGQSYAVVTLAPVTLTSATPCKKTTVAAVTHSDFQFTRELVPVELHLNFQAAGLKETDGGDIDDDLLSDKDQAAIYSGGILVGTPMSDVGNVRHLRTVDD